MSIEGIGQQAGRRGAELTVEAAQKVVKKGFWRSLGEKIGVVESAPVEMARDALNLSEQAVSRSRMKLATIVHDVRAETVPVLFDSKRFRFLEKNAQQANSPSYWLQSDAGARAMFKEPRATGPKGTFNPEAGNERLGAAFGLRLGLPVNKVQLGKFDGKIGSLHYDVGQPGNPSVQFMRIAPEFKMQELMKRGHSPYRHMSTYERLDAAAHWQKLQQVFANPEIWDRTDFFDRTINNLRHGENYLLTKEGNKFQVHLIDNGGGFDGRIYDGTLPSLDKELKDYQAFLDGMLAPKRAIYLQNVLADLQRFAAIPPGALKADVAEIPDQFLTRPYRDSAAERLLKKQKLVKDFLARL